MSIDRRMWEVFEESDEQCYGKCRILSENKKENDDNGVERSGISWKNHKFIIVSYMYRNK